MLELIRRLLLAGGIAGFFVLALSTTPALVLVAPVDFAADMAREYRVKSGPRFMGVMELAKEFIQKATKPASLQAYIDRKTEHRLIRVSGDNWEAFFQALDLGVSSPYAHRQVKKGGAYAFRWDETPLATLQDRIEAMSKTWTVNYLVLTRGTASQYLEVRYGYGFEPRQVGAPTSLVFPWRRFCWLPPLLGVAGFALLRRRQPPGEMIYKNYLGSCLPLDICGFLFFALFFAIPLWISDPTQRMWGDNFGVALLCWLAAAGALALVVAAAANASFAIRFGPGQVYIARLFGSRSLQLAEIVAAIPLQVGGIKSGLILELKDQSLIKVPWTNLVNYHLLQEALRQAGFKDHPHLGPVKA
jgi:hypothetical protein